MRRPTVISFHSVCFVLLLASFASAAKHRVEPLKEKPPGDLLSAEIAEQLSTTGVKVIRGTKRTVCEIWLCQEWSAKDSFKATKEVVYPFEPGQLVGVIRYARKGRDFRNQGIPKGVYTLRYAQQPVDGNHVGTSATRDFLLLVSSETDKSKAPMDAKKLGELSAETIGSQHPGLLSMQKPSGQAPQGEPNLRHVEETDWWVLRIQGKAKAGTKVQALPIGLVVVGHADE